MTAERQSFPARTEMFPQVAAFVEKRCAALGVDRQATLRLLLVAEELFINTSVHGYRDRGGAVTLTVRDSGGEVELIAEDGAQAFNPFADLAQPVAPADPRDAAIGGLGRALVAGISSRHAYERREGRNRVTVGVLKQRGGK
jgi:anti-sigma regulatory factor (Ser/Thr protein kinase)